MITKNIKVIFDTNVWVSFLIGKRLSSIGRYISDGNITIITIEQLLNEIKLVTGRKDCKNILQCLKKKNLKRRINIPAN